MPQLAAIAVLCWLATAAITAGLGWLMVRFLPLWASIPLTILLALFMTIVGMLGIAFAVPGDSKQIKRGANIYSIVLTLAVCTPGVIATALFKYAA